MVNLVEMVQRLHNQASQQSDRLAILDLHRHQSIAFAQLNQAAEQFAILLQNSGVQAGDTVLVLLSMSIDLPVALLALLQLEAIIWFVEPSVGHHHLKRHDFPFPKALIAHWNTHLRHFRSPAYRRIPIHFSIGFPFPGTISWSADTAPLPRSPSNTGKTVLTTRSIDLLTHLASGATSLILSVDQAASDLQPARMLRQIQKYQPNAMTASPDGLEQLADFCERRSLKLLNFHRLLSDGTPMLPRLLDRLQTRAPQAEITSVYGSPNLHSIARITYRQIQMPEMAAMSTGKGLLVGEPDLGLQLRIVRDRPEQAVSSLTEQAFAGWCLSNQQVGEIVVQDGLNRDRLNVLQGAEPPDQTMEVAGVIWHRTGDAGYVDEQGRLWLLGRCNTRIEDEQGVLYPFAVEVAASFHDGVRRTAIVSQQGQRILLIELKRSAVRDAVAREACLNTLKLVLNWAKIQTFQVVPSVSKSLKNQNTYVQKNG
jgi:acyl-CoA synthetase (AMP-forming)/AMP-acid ligase II